MLFGIFMALLDIRLETVQKKIRMRVFFFFFFALLYWPTSKELFYFWDSIDISVPSFHLILFAIITH